MIFIISADSIFSMNLISVVIKIHHDMPTVKSAVNGGRFFSIVGYFVVSFRDLGKYRTGYAKYHIFNDYQYNLSIGSIFCSSIILLRHIWYRRHISSSAKYGNARFCIWPGKNIIGHRACILHYQYSSL